MACRLLAALAGALLASAAAATTTPTAPAPQLPPQLAPQRPAPPPAAVLEDAEPEDAASEEQAAEIFARMDSDRDGQVSLEEFERGLARPIGSQRKGVVYQKLPARFRALDGDGSGYLEAAEYARLGQRWQPGGEPPALSLADRNRDGRVDFREFAALHAPRDDAYENADATAR